MGKPKDGGASATWELDVKMIFCDLCIKEIELGNRPTTHFNKEGWLNLMKNFSEKTGREYDKVQLKNKWDQLKKDWKLWKDLKRGSTGLGWDPRRKTIDAPDEWWKEKLEVVPNAKKFKYCGINPELEHKLDSMFMGVVATGVHAWTPNQGIDHENVHGDTEKLDTTIDSFEDPSQSFDSISECSQFKRPSSTTSTDSRKKKFVVNRSVETYLRCFVSETPKQWAKWLAWAEYWYNTSFHSATKMTPFKVLYGRDPPHLVHYSHSSTPVSAVDQHLKERDQVLEELKRHLFRAQQLMKKQADGKRRDIQFAVGDKVYLKLRPYRQRTMAQRRNEKLAARYFGPFEVEERIGEVAYRLRLPPTARIHPVFHVSQLRRVVGEHAVSPELPSTLREDMEVTLEPLAVEGVRINEKGEKEFSYDLSKHSGNPKRPFFYQVFILSIMLDSVLYSQLFSSIILSFLLAPKTILMQ
ncbi:hypothetical protein KFK09_009130 [Dendrobium nobile]|uniref:Myb/SANT-like domain-containing protein n=1 Tax=Dendrobium nobile TaxID=94219 RepID=A0A8T3BMI9_DENNO|nr:hypothetical protein KFK09_009126 [Dendrobium nobile]KAI0516455.1 hypothetical protein KFK09_009130 [Dendrobium nobile]